ncbi:MAG: hypothetical protein V3T47_09490 [Gammaproteobacteria bacterium]
MKVPAAAQEPGGRKLVVAGVRYSPYTGALPTLPLAAEEEVHIVDALGGPQHAGPPGFIESGNLCRYLIDVSH